jgi:hypothetical protein
MAEQKGASLKVLEPKIDTGGPMGRMVLTVLGLVAEMELGFIRVYPHTTLLSGTDAGGPQRRLDESRYNYCSSA